MEACDDPSQIFLVLDHRAMPINGNTTVAVETLFSSYWVFNVDYPSSLKPIYLFMELLFGVGKSSKKIPSTSRDFMMKLDARMKSMAIEKETSAPDTS